MEIAQAEGARVVNVEEKGYGNALKGGILASRGEYVLMADSDDSYDFSHAPRFAEQLRAGSDLVMGNRFRGGIRIRQCPFCIATIGNPVLSGIGKIVFQIALRRFSLRHSGLSQRQFPTDGYPFDGHGVRQRDGGEGQPAADEGQRGAHDALSRRAQSRRRICAPGATAGGISAFC